MKKYTLSALFALSFVWWVPQNTKAQQAKKPNIIIILVDDLGWGDVGYHGGNIPTPNIDRFAKQGVELNRFYSAAVCSPTRAGLLTGRYPDRFGLRKTVIPPWSDFGVSTDEVFLPQMLEKAGYKNRAVLGKWHLGHVALKYHPLNRGFTHFYGHLNGAIDYFTHTREGELDWHNDFETSYDKGYSTDLIANEAIINIKSYSQTSPFFLYIAFNAPHGPLQAKNEDLLRFGYNAAKPSFPKNGREGEQGRGNTKPQTYAAMVNNLDANIGRILQTLSELKLDENTIVLFQSDNGPAPNEAGSSGELRGTKFTEWEGGVRIPAIIRWPKGFKGGWKSEQVMGYIDVFPTLMAVAGISEKTKMPLDGINVLPVLAQKQVDIKRNLFLGAGVLVNSEWKILEKSNQNANMKLTSDLLFKIDQDTGEHHDVKDKNNSIFQSLKKQLLPFNAIKAPIEVSNFDAGRKGFVAPIEWKVGN